mgnify:CR=1 FL=1
MSHISQDSDVEALVSLIRDCEMKTKKSAAKRFSKTGSGKVKYNKSGNRHLSTKKSPNRKRRLRKATTISKAMEKRTKTMIQ